MRIDELSLKGFGKWQDASFRFGAGLNVFAAPNESGKSTLLQGIFAALYGLKRDYVKSARYLPEYEKYRPWHQGDYETIISYRLGDKSYRLHRCLLREREQSRLFLEPEWTELTDIYMEDRRKERPFLEQHLGLTRSLFTDIAWIKRGPLFAAEHLMPALAQNEEANPAASRMLAELDRDLAAIGKKERAESTLLGKAGALLAQKEAELASAESAWKIISQLTRQIAEWEDEKRDLEHLHSRLRQRQQRLREREQSWQKRWEHSHTPPESDEEWEGWSRSAGTPKERQIHEEARAALARMDASSLQVGKGKWDDVDRDRLLADYDRGVQLRRQREEGHVQLAMLAATMASRGGRQDRADRQKKKGGAPVRLFGMAGALAVLGIVLAIFDQALSAGVLLAGSALLAGTAWVRMRAKANPSHVSDPAAQEIQNRQRELADLDDELQRLIGAWGVPSWETFAQMREEALGSLRDRESVQLQDRLVRQEEKARLLLQWGEQLRAVWETEKAELEREQAAMLVELERVERQIQHLREQIARANGEVAAHDAVSLAKAKSEQEEAASAMQQLLQKREALQIARDALQEAVAEWNRDVSPGINERASEVFAQITAGEYRDVRLDPQEGFAVRLLEPARQLVLDLEQCSTGTQDQLYLAQRLALLSHVSQNSEPLPLFFDDHFVHYDDERLRRTLEFLAELSEKHQIFLFTCQDRELRILEPWLGVSDRHVVHTLG